MTFGCWSGWTFLKVPTDERGGSVRVEIQDSAGRPMRNFTVDDCLPVNGDHIAIDVRWKQGRDVSGLAGKAIRLRFVVKDADVFSFRFRK
ncbi:MAG: hypothetical protein KatS3mg105_0208 [Gemmatales bacterium]|nr:MAG: hypothetical protein KatS3mg105_0208 [Gemmatales bacterium]